MKKFAICLALFATLFFVVSCGGGSKNDDKTDSGDSGETVTDGDTADTEPAGDSEPSDTTADDGDATDSAPDGGDSTDSTPDEEVVTAPCDPNPCLNIAGSNGSCTEKDGAYECECLKNYTWKDNDCVGDSKKTPCANLPENAVWNSASEITQTWDGSMWEPSRFGIYDEEASTTECRFKCKEKYKWDGAKCAVFIPECSSENADKTCKDYKTGYIWSAKSPTKIGHDDIVPYCQELTTDDLSWKTPNIDELRTIIKNCDKTEFEGSCPVSVENWNKEIYDPVSNVDCQGCSPVEGTEYSIFGHKIGDPSEFYWSSTQALQDSYMYWIVFFADTGFGRIGTDFDANSIRCLGSGKCPEHYELNGNFECVPATRVVKCEGLPENAVGDPTLNGGSNIMQTWDEESGKWLPESTQFKYCSNYNPYECCFRCSEANYSYNEATKKCEQMTRTVKCEGLPANAEWNTASEIVQTQWSDGTWLPSSIGVYDTSSSTTNCRYKCKNGFWWNGDKCESKTRTVKCEGLPANAEWNTAEEIKQERNDSGWWTPSNEGVYNETASTKECRFKCKKNYGWNGSGCGENTRTVKCSNLPENAEWWNPVSEITQTQDVETGQWLPSNKAVYSDYESTIKCRFKCKSGGFSWDGSSCSKPECNSPNFQNQLIRDTCYDSTSDLSWSKMVSRTWDGAVEYCNELVEWGYDDWRLPNISELRTLIQNCSGTITGGSCDVIDTGNPLTSCLEDSCWRKSACKACPVDNTGIYSKLGDVGYFWSSSSLTNDKSRVWFASFYSGAINDFTKNSSQYFIVRCVR
ncbi:DUF1566 domain-containing protein [bacterium]|nr:DUF1566 domain-containing protein [bacterium]